MHLRIVDIIATSGFVTALYSALHRPGLRPSLQRSPDLLAGLRDPTSKEKGKGKKGRGREVRKVETPLSIKFMRTPLDRPICYSGIVVHVYRATA